MKRYISRFQIEFTTNAKSKKDARTKFIMQVLNHTNLLSGGETKIDVSDKDFKEWAKNTSELLF